MSRPAVVLAGGALFSLAVLAFVWSNFHSSVYAAVVSCAGVILFLSCLKREYQQAVAGRSLAAVIAMPIVVWSVSLTNIWFLCLLMCFWVPLMAGRFDRIVPIYVFSILLVPSLDISAFVGGLKLFQFGVLDALAVGSAVAIYVSRQKARPRIQSDIAAMSVCLVIGMALGRETSLTNVLRSTCDVVLDLGLPYYILSRGLRNKEDVRAAMLWLACGGLALSAVLIFEVSRTWPLYNELYGLYQIPTTILVKMRGGAFRAYGPFGEATSTAMVLAMCLVALYLLREQFRSWLHHALLLGVAFVGMSAPQSRGAWIGFFIALAAADVFRGRYFSLCSKLIVVGAAVAVILSAAQLSPELSESVGLSGGSSATAEYRERLLDRGMEEFWQSPVIGFPPAEVRNRLEDLKQGEGIVDFVNTYLWMGLIAGVIGVMILLAAFLYFLGSIWRNQRRMIDTAADPTAAFTFSCIVMVMEMLFFTSFGGRPAFLTFGLFGIAAALSPGRPTLLHGRVARAETSGILTPAP